MSEIESLKTEEREVLSSIYEGDQCFKQIDSNTFQYKYGENDTIRSFILEIRWGPQYPEELPAINMDLFYNKHIIPSLKSKIIDLVKTEGEQFLGMSMTYSLFEYIKERFDELIKEQPENTVELNVDKLHISEYSEDTEDVNTKKEKKEQLTKAQKRRQWTKLDCKGEKPRGWNWVDLIKHLSQTGAKENAIKPVS